MEGLERAAEKCRPFHSPTVAGELSGSVFSSEVIVTGESIREVPSAEPVKDFFGQAQYHRHGRARYDWPMFELSQAIPDADVLLALEPEELGAKLLFLLRKRSFQMNMFHPPTLTAELWPSLLLPGQQTPYPQNRREAIDLALVEAWAWLEAQGLMVPAPDLNGVNGWRVLSRRARRFESEAEFAGYAVARMLPRGALHPRIADRVWMAFMRGEFDVAAFQAMKAVEVAVRTAAQLGGDLIGVKLIREAFALEAGPLTDMNAGAGERAGRMELFAGAIACYKNPHSHRDVNLDDPVEAMEIILLANHLLRIVDARVRGTG